MGKENNFQKGFWLSMVEYSQYRKRSISTIRRYIKAETIRFKKEEGKFWIFVPEENYQKSKLHQLGLKEKMEKLQEENDELKMLVRIYEQRREFEQNV